ncbi:calmodulin-binding-domain-containing protein [Phlyctochytrium arcticum]|nr:calmodulin-binding-domain-containing protein [Phlyctochytrium arcticum]
MEARKMHLRQMAGTAVGMILKPSRGVRDDIIRSGGKPKDHCKENRLRLKSMQKANKAQKEEDAKPEPRPFKLKQFEDVPSKLQTRRISSSSTLVSSHGSEASRPSTAGSAHSTTSKKNFISINAAKARHLSPPVPKTPEPTLVERKTKKGQVPKYLVDRKLEWADRERARQQHLEEVKIPPGMTLVPEEERIATLVELQRRQDELMDALSKFPVIIETISMKRRKAIIESQLNEIEAAKDAFSKKKVYVPQIPESAEQVFVVPEEPDTGVGVWDRARRTVQADQRMRSHSPKLFG